MKSRSLWNMAAAAMALGLAGCATVNDKALRLFSSEAQAFAIVNGQLLQGAESPTHMSRSDLGDVCWRNH